MHVSITPEIITHIFGIPITNTLVASLLTTVVLVVIVYFLHKKSKRNSARLAKSFRNDHRVSFQDD